MLHDIVVSNDVLDISSKGNATAKKNWGGAGDKPAHSWAVQLASSQGVYPEIWAVQPEPQSQGHTDAVGRTRRTQALKQINKELRDLAHNAPTWGSAGPAGVSLATGAGPSTVHIMRHILTIHFLQVTPSEHLRLYCSKDLACKWPQ